MSKENIVPFGRLLFWQQHLSGPFPVKTVHFDRNQRNSFQAEPHKQSGLGAMGIKLYYTTVTASRTVSPADVSLNVAVLWLGPLRQQRAELRSSRHTQQLPPNRLTGPARVCLRVRAVVRRQVRGGIPRSSSVPFTGAALFAAACRVLARSEGGTGSTHTHVFNRTETVPSYDFKSALNRSGEVTLPVPQSVIICVRQNKPGFYIKHKNKKRGM